MQAADEKRRSTSLQDESRPYEKQARLDEYKSTLYEHAPRLNEYKSTLYEHALALNEQ